MVFGNTGASAIEIKFDNRQELPRQAQVRFFIPAEPGSINQFGKSLANWAGHPKEIFRAEFTT
jgi:hypothetical protein